MPNNVTTKVWYSNGMTYPWPEQAAGVKPNVGICLSGGGTRAMSAAMGQLRALIDIGFLSHVDYISSVSGGSWAAGAFTYYRAGAANDAEFLGPITDPKDITRTGLDDLPQSRLGWGATLDLGDAIERAILDGFKEDFVWAAAIGDLFFKRYGLWDNANQSYFSLDDATVAAIKAANPSLANADFATVRKPSGYAMPYLLMNATIDGPTKGTPYSSDPMIMVTYTPLYCGIPFQQAVEYNSKHLATLGATVNAVVGGGFIEPFAWNGGSPAGPAVNGRVTVSLSEKPFGVMNASATSSSAFAAALEKIKGLDHLLPEQSYWPPMATGTQQAAQSFDFGDGGNLENFGLIPLVMRNVKKVAVFVNTEVPLSTSYDPTTQPTGKDVDSDVTNLFGITEKNSSPLPNQIFPTADFATLIRTLQAKKKAGQPLVARMTHDVVANSWWGVPGGTQVEVVWFYLDGVSTWRSQIGSEEVKIQLDLGDVGEFAHFPNYKTIDENPLTPWSLTQLTARQVNLLADLTDWIVRQSRGELEALLG